VIQFSDGVVITHGRHVLHTGFELWRDRINIFYSAIVEAWEHKLLNAFTSSTGTSGTGGAPEAAFSWIASNRHRGIPGGGWGSAPLFFAGYVQDDWRITNNLTLNVGVRYEAHTPWVETE